MSFRSFVGGAVRILFGWGVFVFAVLMSVMFLAAGYTIVGVGAFVIALLGGLFAEYHRGRQGQRVRGGGNTYR